MDTATCAYVCGKKSTSIEPSRSSSTADAHGTPALLTRRSTLDRIPPIVTDCPSPIWSPCSAPDRALRVGREHVLDAEQRVVGDVQPEHLPLEREPGHLVPLAVRHGHREHGVHRVVLGAIGAEEVELPGRLDPLRGQEAVHGLVEDRHQAAPGVPERVERARLDQRLDDLLVAGDRRRPS